MSEQINRRAKAKKILLKPMDKMVAGVDIGSRSHFIAIPGELSDSPVKEFGVFTADLKDAAAWLKSHKIKSIAMESTGVYWIPMFEILEEEGFEVILVNAHHVKNVPGRKSDVLDCQWIQQLHSYGLLRGAFRPDGDTCTLRGLMRQRSLLVQEGAAYKLRMQKALIQMNVLLHNVISEISGDLGLKIIREIIAGNRDPKALASLRTDRYKSSEETIEKSLDGNYRAEHVLCLKQALEFHDFCQLKLSECDVEIEKILEKMCLQKESGQTEVAASKPKKRRKNELYFDAKSHLKKITGVDLTKVDGLEEQSILKILSETGSDMSKWKTVKHFTSWLGLSPGTKISGGKKLSTRTKRCKQRAAYVFRIAANTLLRNDSATGAFLRRKRAQLGAAEAITATAHRLARFFYFMLKEQKEYKDTGADYYEHKYKEKIIKNLTHRAQKFGLILIKDPNPTHKENASFTTS